MLPIALILAGCSPEPYPVFSTDIVVVEKQKDAGEPARAEDAAMPAQDATKSFANEAGQDGGLDAEDAADADLDAMCYVSSLGDGWTASDRCGASVASQGQCPPCLPYVYACSSQKYPSSLDVDGSVMSPFFATPYWFVCSNMSFCVDSLEDNYYCPTSFPRAFTCPSPDARLPSSDGGCVDVNFADYGKCCK